MAECQVLLGRGSKTKNAESTVAPSHYPVMQIELRLKVFGQFANWINTKVHREGDTFQNKERRGDEKMQEVGGDHLNQPTDCHHEGPGKNRSVYLLLGHQIFFIFQMTGVW